MFKFHVTQLAGIRGPIIIWCEGNLTWVKADLLILPEWKFEQLTKASETVVWAWIDKKKGIVRARTFVSDWGIPEDEANGSGSMLLASNLGRDLIIHHGKGSIVYTRPSKPGFGEIGGLVKSVWSG